MKSVVGLAVFAALCSTVIGCTKSPMNPTLPTAATTATAAATAADGSTLKVTAPATIDPTNGTITPSRTPTLVWGNSEGKYEGVGLAYDIELSVADGSVIYARTVGESPNTGTHAIEMTLPYDTPHWWRVRAHLGSTVGPWSGFAEFRTLKQVVVAPPTPTGGPSPTGFRTPDPPGGQRLPRRNDIASVFAYDALHPGQLRNSCQVDGGSWAFLDGVVDTLQAIDLRYGYNCKRGNCNDPSLDVISYHWGPGNDEGSADVYCTDLIAGHCGGSPSIIWNDVTQVTLDSNTICRVIFTRPGRVRPK